jgi:hypothetical protein
MSLILVIGITLSGVATWDVEVLPKVPVTHCGTIDEYGVLSFKQEQLRLKQYFALLKDYPDTYAVVYVRAGGRVPFEQAKARAIRSLDYLVNGLHVRANQIAAAVVENPPYDNEFMIQLIRCPPSEGPLKAVPFDKSLIIQGTEIEKHGRK